MAQPTEREEKLMRFLRHLKPWRYDRSGFWIAAYGLTEEQAADLVIEDDEMARRG